jgi:hypothetical protein
MLFPPPVFHEISAVDSPGFYEIMPRAEQA